MILPITHNCIIIIMYVLKPIIFQFTMLRVHELSSQSTHPIHQTQIFLPS